MAAERVKHRKGGCRKSEAKKRWLRQRSLRGTSPKKKRRAREEKKKKKMRRVEFWRGEGRGFRGERKGAEF